MERRGISNEMNNSKFLQVKSQQCFPKMAFSFIGFFPLKPREKSWVESWLSLLIRIWERTEMAEADFLSSMQQNWASKVESSAPFTKLGEKKKKLRKWQWNIERSMYVVSFSIRRRREKRDFLCQEQRSSSDLGRKFLLCKSHLF